MAFFTPIRDFLKDSRAGGVILICCTVLSFTLANTAATQQAYVAFWEKGPLFWINDVLMTFFFFLVGMEIKRQLVIGELASVKRSLLPVLAALGGMVCPALIFSMFNGHTVYQHGWGIPMATDIAFSLAILSLLGKKVPVQLKIFLTALAIIDDLGAVVTIAVFYTSVLQLVYLLCALGALGVVYTLNRMQVKQTVLYLIPGIVMWYCIYHSGVHATITGVIMAFCMPLPRLARLEHLLHVPVNFIIMPLFALANTAIVFPASFGHIFSSTVSTGVIMGLVIGKPIGIFLFSFIAVKLGVAALPSGSSYRQLLGMGMLGGIGFTMSIFTTSLAYNDQATQIIAKVSIITASMIAGLAGYTYLFLLKPSAHQAPVTAHYGEEATYMPQPEPVAG